jgi:hypothetical protein
MKTKLSTLNPLLLASLLALATLPAAAGPFLFDNTNPSPAYNFNAYSINEGFAVTDSFTLAQTSTITGVTFVTWTNPGDTFPGDTVTSVDWAITDSAFGGATEDSGTATGLPNTFIETNTNTNGYDVLQQSFNINPNEVLAAGTYWLEFSDAVSAESGPVYWDESDGSASAQLSGFGSIGSETFQIVGVPGGTPSGIPGDPGTPAGGGSGPGVVPEGSTFSFLLLGGLAFFGYSFFRNWQTGK